jgi:hypothetical protein
MPAWLLSILKLFINTIVSFIGNALSKLIAKLVRRGKDKKNVSDWEKEGKEKLGKIEDAKNNKDKSAYIDIITDI